MRMAASLGEVFSASPYLDASRPMGYDLTIGTSERGRPIAEVERQMPPFRCVRGIGGIADVQTRPRRPRRSGRARALDRGAKGRLRPRGVSGRRAVRSLRRHLPGPGQPYDSQRGGADDRARSAEASVRDAWHPSARQARRRQAQCSLVMIYAYITARPTRATRTETAPRSHLATPPSARSPVPCPRPSPASVPPAYVVGPAARCGTWPIRTASPLG